MSTIASYLEDEDSNDASPPLYSSFGTPHNPDNLVPAYSEVAALSEHVLSDANSQCTHCFVYASDHMELSLGRSLWGTAVPVYGRCAKVAGHVRFKKSCSYVAAVSITVRFH